MTHPIQLTLPFAEDLPKQAPRATGRARHKQTTRRATPPSTAVQLTLPFPDADSADVERPDSRRSRFARAGLVVLRFVMSLTRNSMRKSRP